MDCLTKEDVLEIFREFPEDARFCPTCFNVLRQGETDKADSEGNTGVIKMLYCPNEVCLDQDNYDLYGNLIKE